ncbi:MAG TPA: hypothetical protein VIC08_12965 [Cellvibrionaceae bacterium]
MSEALDQIKEASSSVYDAVSSIGAASADTAKLHMEQGKEKAFELSEKAESVAREKPLVTIGVAFAAGWLVSRLMQSSGKH